MEPLSARTLPSFIPMNVSVEEIQAKFDQRYSPNAPPRATNYQEASTLRTEIQRELVLCNICRANNRLQFDRIRALLELSEPIVLIAREFHSLTVGLMPDVDYIKDLIETLILNWSEAKHLDIPVELLQDAIASCEYLEILELHESTRQLKSEIQNRIKGGNLKRHREEVFPPRLPDLKRHQPSLPPQPEPLAQRSVDLKSLAERIDNLLLDPTYPEIIEIINLLYNSLYYDNYPYNYLKIKLSSDSLLKKVVFASLRLPLEDRKNLFNNVHYCKLLNFSIGRFRLEITNKFENKLNGFYHSLRFAQGGGRKEQGRECVLRFLRDKGFPEKNAVLALSFTLQELTQYVQLCSSYIEYFQYELGRDPTFTQIYFRQVKWLLESLKEPLEAYAVGLGRDREERLLLDRATELNDLFLAFSFQLDEREPIEWTPEIIAEQENMINQDRIIHCYHSSKNMIPHIETVELAGANTFEKLLELKELATKLKNFTLTTASFAQESEMEVRTTKSLCYSCLDKIEKKLFQSVASTAVHPYTAHYSQSTLPRVQVIRENPICLTFSAYWILHRLRGERNSQQPTLDDLLHLAQNRHHLIMQHGGHFQPDRSILLAPEELLTDHGFGSLLSIDLSHETVITCSLTQDSYSQYASLFHQLLSQCEMNGRLAVIYTKGMNSCPFLIEKTRAENGTVSCSFTIADSHGSYHPSHGDHYKKAFEETYLSIEDIAKFLTIHYPFIYSEDSQGAYDEANTVTFHSVSLHQSPPPSETILAEDRAYLQAVHASIAVDQPFFDPDDSKSPEK